MVAMAVGQEEMVSPTLLGVLLVSQYKREGVASYFHPSLREHFLHSRHDLFYYLGFIETHCLAFFVCYLGFHTFLPFRSIHACLAPRAKQSSIEEKLGSCRTRWMYLRGIFFINTSITLIRTGYGDRGLFDRTVGPCCAGATYL